MFPVQRWPLTNLVWRQFEIFDLVMERARIDMACAARMDGGKAMAEAHRTCLHCPVRERCRSLLARGAHPGEVMAICPNADFFARCARMKDRGSAAPDGSPG